MTTHSLKLDPIKLREKWRKLPNYGCFWSSPDNPRGLQLTPTIEPGKLWVEMEIDRERSGFPGIAHGGVAFTILDGLMSWFIMAHTGRGGFTTECKVEYFGPLHVGKRYRFEVIETEAQNPKLVSLVGRVFNALEQGGHPLIKMQANFFLPNRKKAIQVLGIPLGPEGEELFPEE